MNSGKRILFVDNDTEITKRSVKILKKYNHDIHIATSGKFALRVMRLNIFDLIIADINMPGMDCIEFVKRIRKNHLTQSIVLFVNPSLFKGKKESFKLGTIVYLTKPFSAACLLDAVDKSRRIKSRRILGSTNLTWEELIQLYSLGQRTVILQISSGIEIGQFFFKNGRLIHATVGNLVGEDAVFEVLAWHTGSFSTLPLYSHCPCTIKRAPDTLLMEWNRMKIDKTRINSKQDPVHQNQEIGIAF